MNNRMQDFAARGLYDPFTERSNCGVGAIANLKGIKSHDIVHKAIEILANLEHRGACGCDPNTGDGAGVMLQVPHEFYKKIAPEFKIKLPGEHEYGVGLVFLPTDKKQRAKCEEVVESVIAVEGQQLLGWRDVPTDNGRLGKTAFDVEPVILQVFIGRGAGIKDNDAFERKLFVLRKMMENGVRALGLTQGSFFYIPSLSHRNVVYKGLLLAPQIESFFPDLVDPDTKSALVLVH